MILKDLPAAHLGPVQVNASSLGSVKDRVARHLQRHCQKLWVATDRMFAILLAFQLVAGIAIALFLSPYTWIGNTPSVHLHVWASISLGTLLTIVPICLAFFSPGKTLTRHVIAVTQMLWSALLIHLCGGRLETHFHVFVSLAFLAAYRDWKVLVTATIVIALDHFARGVYWPQSVFGETHGSSYRWMEHAAWVLFEDWVLVGACVRGTRETTEICERRVELEFTNEIIEDQISSRTKQLSEANTCLLDSHQFLNSTLDSLSSRIAILDQNCQIVETNAHWKRAEDGNPFASSGFSTGENYLDRCSHVVNADSDSMVEGIHQLRSGEVHAWHGAYSFEAPTGDLLWFSVKLTHFTTGTAIRVVVCHDDITALKNLEGQLVQSQKLEAVGQLAAGVAHEINTPIQYIGDNARFLQDSSADLMGVLNATIQLVDLAAAGTVTEEQVAMVREKIKAADIDYLSEEIPSAIEHSIDGVNRVAKIVQAMKEFSHPGQEGKSRINLNSAIESTITVATSEWKYVADIVRDFDSEVTGILCLPGELNQVILNLLVNASHTIADVVGKDGEAKGTITVVTKQLDDAVEVRISDTGAGIPVHAREKIFDPFFTTKEVGKGTGQGLSMAHSIITERHDGTIRFETELGVGTTFIIRLPQTTQEA